MCNCGEINGMHGRREREREHNQIADLNITNGEQASNREACVCLIEQSRDKGLRTQRPARLTGIQQSVCERTAAWFVRDINMASQVVLNYCEGLLWVSRVRQGLRASYRSVTVCCVIAVLSCMRTELEAITRSRFGVNHKQCV